MRRLISAAFSLLGSASLRPDIGYRSIGPGKRRAKVCHKRADNPRPMTRQVARRITIDAGWPSHSFRHYLAQIERTF